MKQTIKLVILAIVVVLTSFVLAQAQSITVALPTKQDPPGGPSTIPITVGDMTGRGVFSYDFDLVFNQAVLQPQPTPFDATGSLSSGLAVTFNSSTAGHLIINVFSSSTEIAGQGLLLNLKFNVIGPPASTSPLTWAAFEFNEGDPPDTDINGQFTAIGPSAANGIVSGRIVDHNGMPVEGAVVRLSGEQTRKTITDAKGRYYFDNVETNGFYTVTPSRVNYNFNPFNRSFNQIGNNTEAAFTGEFTGDALNTLDTPEYFVRQQYVDILGREPDEGGFNYWSNEILRCGSDLACVSKRRRDVAAAFFIEQEFQQTGSFIYDLYKSSLGRRPVFKEYAADRKQVAGGPDLDTQKAAFAESFVQRAEFVAKYQANATAESFVDALLQKVQQGSGVDLGSQRDNLVTAYNSSGGMVEGRALVMRAVADNAALKQAEYNAAFVMTEYFGYLRRDAEPEGYSFWLNVVTNGDVGNYHGMVCSFITSEEYQKRFSTRVTHSNGECGN